MSEDESNEYRSDGGYHRYGKHWYPGEPGFKENHPTNSTPQADEVRGINLTSFELSSLISHVQDTITSGVERGLNVALNSAAAITKFSQTPSTSGYDPTRRIYPAASNNIMVSISNPSQAQAIAGANNHEHGQEHVEDTHGNQQIDESYIDDDLQETPEGRST